MPFQHTRRPEKLDDDDYGDFVVKLKEFLADPNSLPHRPTQFVAEQIVRADAFIPALDEFHVAETNMHNSSAVVKATVNGISAKLLWFKYILPTLIIGPDTLVKEFGLDGELPEDYEEIKNLGDEVWAHWLTHRDKPLFDPIRDDGNLLEGLLKAYDNARTLQNNAQNLYHNKSVAKTEARESHHELEREIFAWYRANYTNPQDIYWTKTPGGKSPGEGGSGKLAAPTKLMYDMFRNDFTWNPVEKATGYELEILNKSTQETSIFKTELNQKRVSLAKGDYIAKVRAVKEASEAEY